MIAEVDVVHILELVWVAPLAALAVTITFAGCVLGATRSSDSRREGDRRASGRWMALALVAGLAVLAQVAIGISVIVAG